MTPHPCAQDPVPPGVANGRRAASALASAISSNRHLNRVMKQPLNGFATRSAHDGYGPA